MQTSVGFEQSYNAQAGVEVESGLIVTRHVTQNTNDKKEIEPTLEQLREIRSGFWERRRICLPTRVTSPGAMWRFAGGKE